MKDPISSFDREGVAAELAKHLRLSRVDARAWAALIGEALDEIAWEDADTREATTEAERKRRARKAARERKALTDAAEILKACMFGPTARRAKWKTAVAALDSAKTRTVSPAFRLRRMLLGLWDVHRGPPPDKCEGAFVDFVAAMLGAMGISEVSGSTVRRDVQRHREDPFAAPLSALSLIYGG